LLPPSLREWLPEDHLAFFVNDLIDQLEASSLLLTMTSPVVGMEVVIAAACYRITPSRFNPA
jgi:hypothetical protein